MEKTIIKSKKSIFSIMLINIFFVIPLVWIFLATMMMGSASAISFPVPIKELFDEYSDGASVFIFLLFTWQTIALTFTVSLLSNAGFAFDRVEVTNKRVFVRGIWERAELPIDSIKSIKSGIKSITFLTVSGNVWVKCVANAADIHREVSKLLVVRQSKSSACESGSIADEIAKFKKLLDDGAITQSEFQAKKTELLQKL